MQTNSQSETGATFCKHHQDVPSRYFLTDQPWIKYCQQCALNVALCGRNISQDFSSEEFQRKMQIVSVVNELRRNTQLAEDNNIYYTKIIDLLEEGAKPLKQHIADIEQSIQKLVSTKDKLQSIYERDIIDKISEYIERQSKVALNCRNIKNQLQSIQSHFSVLVEIENQSLFQQELQKCNQLLKESKQDVLTQEEFFEGKEQILQVMESFYNQIQTLSDFTLNLPIQTKRLKLPTDDTFDMVLTPVDTNINSLSSSMTLEKNLFKKNKKGAQTTNCKTYKDIKRDSLEQKSEQEGFFMWY